MNAILNIDLEVAMNTKNEVTCQITIKILSNLFKKNLITKDEYNKFKHKMLEKCRKTYNNEFQNSTKSRRVH